MLGLAVSSWVKWRVVATGIIFAAVFVPAGVGGIVTVILRTRWGLLLNRAGDDDRTVAAAAGYAGADGPAICLYQLPLSSWCW